VITLDASLLVAHFHRRDPHHQAASRLLADAAGETLLVHSLTLAEVLVGAVRIGRAEDMLDDLRAIGTRLAPSDDEEPMRLARLRVSTGLTLPDCCVLDAAHTNNADVATFDRALARAAQALDLGIVPAPTPRD